MSLKQAVHFHLEQFPTTPFLFVGSGMSRRYVGLEDWEGILRKFSKLTDRPYEYYRATAGNYLPRVATEIARRLHERWWEDDTFAESRQEFRGDAKTVEFALKIEISRYMESVTERLTTDENLLHEIELLRSAVVDGLITTYWDRLLEMLFPEFSVYIGQDELLFSTPQSIGEIYKIHGCCTRPNSLVLTADDYATPMVTL
jgi:SIR2-like domain